MYTAIPKGWLGPQLKLPNTISRMKKYPCPHYAPREVFTPHMWEGTPRSNFSTPWKLTGQNLTIFLSIIFVPLRDRGLVWPLHVQRPSETLVTWNSFMRRVNTLEARSSWSTCTPQFQGHYATQSMGNKKVLFFPWYWASITGNKEKK
jgi:hypothetical protein